MKETKFITKENFKNKEKEVQNEILKKKTIRLLSNTYINVYQGNRKSI